MKWKPYPSYAESGVDLLGSIPSHWRVHRLKHLVDVRLSNVDKLTMDDQPVVRLANYVDVYKNDRITTDMDLMVATASDEQIQRLSLAPQDVLITKDSESPDDIAVPAFVPEVIEGVVCGYHLALLRPDAVRLYGEFLHRWLQGKVSKAYFTSHANGMTRYGIGAGDIGDAPIAWAPMEEQKAIARFLARHTTQIDTLITEQRTLIERLREKRRAVISHTVTKGLELGVPTTPSKIEGIDRIPAHWSERRLKTLLYEPLMYGANEAADGDDPDSPRFVRITDIDDSGQLREETFKSLPHAVAEPYLLQEGDVLLARSGATVGKSFIYRQAWGICCFAGYLIRARFNQADGMRARYFAYCCQSDFYWSFVSSNQIQATIQNLSAERYASLRLPCPPISEQAKIEEFLDRENAKIDTLISEAETSIALLQEHRSALITAVVTGKVDVREATS